MIKTNFLTSIFIVTIFLSCNSSRILPSQNIPAKYIGDFTDDYGIRYHISDLEFVQIPRNTYHILEWNIKEQYIIAKNDEGNSSDKNLYTRIDFMDFENMEPYSWGFCYTIYKAASTAEAKNARHADRGMPKKGCNGFPFSRLKKIL